MVPHAIGPRNAPTSDPNETATWLLSAGILLVLHFTAVAYATGTCRHPSLFFRGFLISLVAALIWAKLVGIGSMDLGLGFGLVAGALTVLGIMTGMGLVSYQQCPRASCDAETDGSSNRVMVDRCFFKFPKLWSRSLERRICKVGFIMGLCFRPGRLGNMHGDTNQAIQNHIRSTMFRGLRSGQKGSSRSISAFPLQRSISFSLTMRVRLTILYPRNSAIKIGISMYGGTKVLALNFPGKKAS